MNKLVGILPSKCGLAKKVCLWKKKNNHYLLLKIHKYGLGLLVLKKKNSFILMVDYTVRLHIKVVTVSGLRYMKG